MEWVFTPLSTVSAVFSSLFAFRKISWTTQENFVHLPWVMSKVISLSQYLKEDCDHFRLVLTKTFLLRCSLLAKYVYEQLILVKSYWSQYELRTGGLRGQLDALCYWINALLFAVFRILAIYSFAFCLQRPRFCNCLLQVLFIKKIVVIRDASAEHEGPSVVYIYFLKLPRVELPCGKGCSLKYLSYVFDSEFCSLTIHKYINYSLNPLHCTSQVWLLKWQISRESSYRNRTEPQPETLVKNCKHKWKKLNLILQKTLQ